MVDVFGLVYQMSTASGHQVELRVTRRSKLAGVMRDCGSSKAVLDYLREAGEYRRAFEIRQHVRRSHAAVSWALSVKTCASFLSIRAFIPRSIFWMDTPARPSNILANIWPTSFAFAPSRPRTFANRSAFGAWSIWKPSETPRAVPFY